ncbi:MAG: tetratricopeptide repeat protein [Deltaproteobacteria bacterium]|nr:tetratricopeptide repeat protein [Deltaproteobacteria bacterium]
MARILAISLTFFLLFCQNLYAEAPAQRKVDAVWSEKSQAILTLITQKKFSKAVDASEKLLAELAKRKMQESYEASTTLNNLGVAYMYNQQVENAHAALVKALAIRIKVLGKDDPETAAVWLNLAELHLEMAKSYRAQYERIAKAIKAKAGKAAPGGKK